MRLCGKRFSRRLGKAFDRGSKERAVRRLPGRSFFWLLRGFLFCGGGAFLLGVFEKKGVLTWCFCGEVVVSRW